MDVNIFYHKIKLLLLEYENIQKLDKDYMEIFLKEFSNNLNLKDENFVNETKEQIFNEYGEKQIFKIKHGVSCIKLYRKLSKKLHPDLNKNNSSYDFVKMSKAYENNDFMTLFLLSYEHKVQNILEKSDITLLNESIKSKEEEIDKIKIGLHWKWVLAENDLERESIKQYVINNN